MVYRGHVRISCALLCAASIETKSAAVRMSFWNAALNCYQVVSLLTETSVYLSYAQYTVALIGIGNIANGLVASDFTQ